jgi:hypothetical protein
MKRQHFFAVRDLSAHIQYIFFWGKKKLIDVAYSGNVCRHYHQKGSKGTLPAPWNVLENH